MDKLRAERVHAKKRALERFGVTLNRHQLRSVVESIRSGRALFLERQSLARTLWLVDLLGQPARAVYGKSRGEIVTFLPVVPDRVYSSSGRFSR